MSSPEKLIMRKALIIALIICSGLLIKAQEAARVEIISPQQNESSSSKHKNQLEEKLDTMASWAYIISQGQVTSIMSGDSLVILSENRKLRVRLLGIQSPEQALSDESRENLSRLVKGRTVQAQAK